MSKIDLETLAAVRELMTPADKHMGQVVPIANQDHDSFASLTSGLKSNWIFLGAIFAGVMFINSSFSDLKINDQNFAKTFESNSIILAKNRIDIDKHTNDILILSTAQVTNYNDLIRKLDSLQASIDALQKQGK